MSATPSPSSLAISAAALQARLQAVLSPTQLEVIDESSQHMGHAGGFVAQTPRQQVILRHE